MLKEAASANLPRDFAQNVGTNESFMHQNTQTQGISTYALEQGTWRVFSASPQMATKLHFPTAQRGSADVELRRHMKPGSFSPPRRRIKDSIQPLMIHISAL